MRNELIKKEYLLNDTIEFIKNRYQNFHFHIVSGSEHNELNYLCKKLGITKYFLTINGSPMAKVDIVSSIIEINGYNTEEIILIGDSINDYDAAVSNKVRFFGFNNPSLEDVSNFYIRSFIDLHYLKLLP